MSNIILGIFLTLLGISMIVESVVPIDLPIFRIFLAVLVIFFGVRLLTGKSGWYAVSAKRRGGAATFSENRHVFQSPEESGRTYSTVFGSSYLDFSRLQTLNENFECRLRVVFGEQIIRIRKNTPYRIRLHSVFSGVQTPEGDAPVLGQGVYSSPGFDPTAHGLDLDVSVVFGSVIIEMVDGVPSSNTI